MSSTRHSSPATRGQEVAERSDDEGDEHRGDGDRDGDDGLGEDDTAPVRDEREGGQPAALELHLAAGHRRP